MSDPPKKQPRPRAFRILVYIDILLIVLFFGLMIPHRNSLYERLHPSSQVTVHITTYGDKYHSETCGYLHSSDYPITLYQAVQRGYGDCSRCITPAYATDYDPVDTWQEYFFQGYGGEYLSEHPVLFSVAFLFIPIVLVTRILTDNSQNKVAVSSSPLPPESVPKQENPRTPTYTTCHLIWLSTYHISRHMGLTNKTLDHGYVWAAMFYIVTKHIRDQKTINRIYDYFEEASLGISDPDPYAPDKHRYVRVNYKYFAPILNQSGIDPRTEAGRDSLWNLLCQQILKHHPPHPSAYKAYQEYADILIADASKYNNP